MELLISLFKSQIKNIKFEFKRYLYDKIDWSDRLIAITGARGTGKTTILLQYIKENLPQDNSVLYISLDNIYFSNHNLVELADEFVKNGGQYLFIDEVHKYNNWSIEIKNMYDHYSNLKIVFTGSSILELYKGQADLSRRMMNYTLYGLSFREYILFENKIKLPEIKLTDIFDNHINLCTEISADLLPIPAFKEYLRNGYYPFYKENKNNYHNRINSVINLILENDLPSSRPIENQTIQKIKKLLYVIASTVPFKPNIAKLSEAIETTRASTLEYLYILSKSQIINLLYYDSVGLGHLTKPEKIYLNNSNLAFALAGESNNRGNLRETFFLNQLSVFHKVTYPKEGDFIIDNKYTIEVGGDSKTYTQIRNIKNSFIAADDIEYGYKNKIPLWLFGFLY